MERMIKKMENREQTFGRVIKYLREERDMSLSELSAMTDLSTSYLSRIETEERTNPTIYALNRLKYALNIDINVIERLFPFPAGEVKPEKEFKSVEELLLNNKFLFAGKLANIGVQFSLRQLIRAFEQYAMKEICDRDDESNILQMADNLRKEVANAI